MSKYTLETSAKTRVFNFFRRFLRTPGAEKAIIKKMLASGPGSKWSKLIPPNYLYSPASMRTVTRDGINYNLDISNVVDHYIYFGYQDKMFETVLPDLKNAKVVFDIGANIGSTAMYFSSINPAATIFAFEPHSGTSARLEANLALNKFKNIKLVKKGLGDKKESVKLFEVNSRNPGMNRIIPGENNFPYVTIEIDTMDNFFNEEQIQGLDFVKIDVEGFEFNVLKGGEQTLTKFLPTLFIELDDDNLRENSRSAGELITLLFGYGYKNIKRVDTDTVITSQTDFIHCHYDIIVTA